MAELNGTVKNSDDNTVGKILSSARKKKRLRYKKLSSELKIDEVYLIALEEENFSLIPGGEAYIKGFLRAYARKLDLNPDIIIDKYNERLVLLCENSTRESVNSNRAIFNKLKEYPASLSLLAFISTLLLLFFLTDVIFERNSPIKIVEVSKQKFPEDGEAEITIEEQSNKNFQETIAPKQENKTSPKIKIKDNVLFEELDIQVGTKSNNEEIISKDQLQLKVLGDCWLEVYSKEERLLYKLAKAGENYSFKVSSVKVIAGNSKNIELSYNDEIVSLERLTNRNQVSCIVLPVGACSEF